MFETISTLKSISEIAASISGQLSLLKGTPKQRLARSFLSLFERLRDADVKGKKVLTHLSKLESRKTTDEIIKVMHSLAKGCDEFSASCEKFEEWVEQNKKIVGKLDLISPEVANPIWKTWDTDKIATPVFSKYGEAIRTEILSLKSGLLKQPSKALRTDIRTECQFLCEQIKLTFAAVRKMTVSQFTIDDLF